MVTASKRSIRTWGCSGLVVGLSLLVVRPQLARTSSEAGPDAPANARPVASAPARHEALRATLLKLSAEHPRVLQKARELSARLAESRSLHRRYPDPRLGLAWSNVPYKRDLRYDDQRTPMTGLEYRLTQAIPFPGRLSTTAGLSDLDAKIKRLELVAEKNRLARELLLRLLRLREIEQLTALTDRYAQQVRVIAETARTRYAVGRGTLADVSRAELAHSRYLERLVDLRGMRAEEARRLSYFLRPLREPAASPESTAASLPVLLGGLDAYLAELAPVRGRPPAKLDEESVVVAMQQTSVRRSLQAEALTAYEYLPDLELFAAYRVRANIPDDPVRGEDFVSFGITLRVPLWSALATPPLRDARKADTRAARAAGADARERVRAAFQTYRARHETLERRLEIYAQRLLPQAERAKDSAREAYVTGKVDFEVLLVSWDAIYLRSAEQLRLRAERDGQLVRMADIFNRILPIAATGAPGRER